MTRKTIVGTNASLGGPATTATIDSSNAPTNSIINNLNVSIKGKPSGDMEYETVKYQDMDDVTVIKPKTRDLNQDDTQIDQSPTQNEDPELLKFLVNTFHGIIVSDLKSLLNIIDQSGLIILDGQSLIGVIARICGVTEDCVKIEIEEEEETGCTGFMKKINPLQPIRKIKVNRGEGFMDFSLAWNSLYNKIQDEYWISLEKIYDISLLDKLKK